MQDADKINLANFVYTCNVKFGTSGIRGYNHNLTDFVVYVYILAFIQYLEANQQLNQQTTFFLAGDLRSTTDHILNVVSLALKSKGYNYKYCGKIPTPALAHYCIALKNPGLMITGSHIPADMNGIKFFKANGEILKSDEQQILAQIITINRDLFHEDGSLKENTHINLALDTTAENIFVKRYRDFFPANGLSNLTIGIYQHSSVARDLLAQLLQLFGAQVISFGRTETFYALDTEALTPQDAEMAHDTLRKFQLDAIVSTDGDGDRPLLADENGEWIHGDIIGMLTSIILQAEHVVMPISCNNSINFYPQFKQIIRTKIGSPYVVEQIHYLNEAGHQSILGYEANGGVLVGSTFKHQDKILSALPTRDSIISILTILNYMNEHQLKLSALVNKYCKVYTVSSSIKDVSNAQTNNLLSKLTEENYINYFFKINANVQQINHQDGLRIYFDNNMIIHLRGSGNAPELRCYTEAATKREAYLLNKQCVGQIKSWLYI